MHHLTHNYVHTQSDVHSYKVRILHTQDDKLSITANSTEMTPEVSSNKVQKTCYRTFQVSVMSQLSIHFSDSFLLLLHTL